VKHRHAVETQKGNKTKQNNTKAKNKASQTNLLQDILGFICWTSIWTCGFAREIKKGEMRERKRKGTKRKKECMCL